MKKETLTELGKATKTLLDLVSEKETIFEKGGSITEGDVEDILRAMGNCQKEAEKLK